MKLNKPRWLKNDTAKKFWDDHAPHLTEAGLLSAETADKFAQVCELWGELRSLDRTDRYQRSYFVQLLKEFRAWEQQFVAPPKKGKGLADMLNEFNQKVSDAVEAEESEADDAE